MEQKLSISIVFDNNLLGERILHRLSVNPSWICKGFNDSKKFLLSNKDSFVVDVLVIYYNHNYSISVDELKELFRGRFRCTKILCVVPEDFILQTKDILLEPNVVDVIRISPILEDMLWNHIVNVHNENKLKKKLVSIEDKTCFLTNSSKMEKVNYLIEKATQTDINVCIYGETGTGKDVIAKRIHNLSKRSTYPFVAINVAAIPEDLAESMFFGHEKGAFTGAVSKKIGFFEEAHNGTLFLDEIGDMSLRMQVKLLRVLQEGRITRVGGRGEIPVNVRVIIATHVDMPSLVEKGLFREDLYYRLMGLTINIPCLAERDNDVLLLAETFINDFCLKNKKPLCSLSESAKKALLAYNFPGNVRELKSIIELAVVLSKDNIIKLEDLSFRDKCDKKQDFFAIERTMEEYESLIIKYFMNKYDNRVRLVADKLNISKTKIYKLLQDEKI
ncbi:MAG: sigma-54 dependent transcriptional regulator [Bacteroidales bacterium]|nr:sigma-54 dependent transcriptional regulator [Bacteroidales bacterium]